MHDRTKIWTTAAGEKIAVSNLKPGHLVNIINWIIDNPAKYPKEIRDLMIAEARYRQMESFARNEDYPIEIDGRWQLVQASTGKCIIETPPAEYLREAAKNAKYVAMSLEVQRRRQAMK